MASLRPLAAVRYRAASAVARAWILAGCVGACADQVHTVGMTAAQTRLSGSASSGSSGTKSVGTNSQTSEGEAGQQAVDPADGSGGSSIKPPNPPPDAGVQTTFSPAPVEQCDHAAPATRRQLDLYLIVDTFITLPLNTGWSTVRAGLSDYVNQPCAAGTRVGMRYFGSECTASSYAMPTTAIAALPDNAAAIMKDMPEQPYRQSPTLPALQGALSLAQARVAMYPDTKQAVVLLSDGFTDFSCVGATGIANIFTGNPPSSSSVPVYVLALDTPGLSQFLDPISRFDPLETIAKNGNTERARHIDLQASAGVFGKALLAIQEDAQPCDFHLPDPAPDMSSASLAIATGTGHSVLTSVSAASACGRTGGYYFDMDANGNSWATLCPVSCTAIKSACGALEWVSGCTTR